MTYYTQKPPDKSTSGDKTAGEVATSVLSEEEKAKLVAGEREKWEKEQRDLEMAEKSRKYEEAEAEKSRKYEEAEAEKKAEEERLEKERVKKEEQEKVEAEKEKDKAKWEKEFRVKEKAEEKIKKPGHLRRNLFIVLLLLVVVAGAGIATFKMDPTLPATGSSFPYVTTYDVLFPQGQSVNFAGTYITAAGTGNKVIVTAGGGQGTEMGIGETRTFSQPKRVILKIFGMTLIDTNYQVDLEFRGYVPSVGKNDFYMTFKTSNQVPQFLIDMLIPTEVNARPI